MTGDAPVRLAAGVSGDPIAPAWLVVPLAILTLLVVAGHALMLWNSDMPATRRRIRLANAFIMMFGTPITAYAFALASPQRKGLFEFVWVLTTGIVLLVLLLAMLDLLNTARLAAGERAQMRRTVRLARRDMLEQARRSRPGA